jgi:hypothetical protein
MKIFMVDGQTMDNHGFRQLSKLMLGLKSNPGNDIFIFYFFNVFCQAEAQNHASVKILAKKLSVIFLSHFYPKNCDYKKIFEYFVEIFIPM